MSQDTSYISWLGSEYFSPGLSSSPFQGMAWRYSNSGMVESAVWSSTLCIKPTMLKPEVFQKRLPSAGCLNMLSCTVMLVLLCDTSHLQLSQHPPPPVQPAQPSDKKSFLKSTNYEFHTPKLPLHWLVENSFACKSLQSSAWIDLCTSWEHDTALPEWGEKPEDLTNNIWAWVFWHYKGWKKHYTSWH